MKTAHIGIQETEFRHESGRYFIELTPVFYPDVTAQGSLSFAVYQVWKDEPETHEAAREKALAGARHCMRLFAGEDKLRAFVSLLASNQMERLDQSDWLNLKAIARGVLEETK